MKIFKYSLTIAAVAMALLISQGARAVTSFDTLSFKPATDHGYYLTTQQSQTLGQLGYAFGLTTEFSNDSLVLKNAAGARIQDIINNEIALEAAGALGITNWLNVGLNVSFVPYQQFNTIGPVTSDTGARMGDIRLDVKARLLDSSKHFVGVALVPFVTFPTGSDTHFVGNGKFTGGGVAVLDTKRFADDRLSFSINAGAQLRSEVTLSPGTVIGHQFIYGAAGNVALVKKKLELIADLSGWTTFSEFFKSNNRNMELNGGLRFFPIDKLAVTAGAGTGLQDGAGAPDFRAFMTVAYRHPREEAPALPPPPEAPKEEVITTNRIHFAFNKSVIRSESYPVINEILDGIKGRPEIESVRVEGHTDSVGSDAYNMKLSEQRANSVRNYLVDHGYPADQVTAAGMGEGSPIADNATKEGRAQNRRVEFHMSIKPGAHVTVKKKGEESPTFEEGDPGNRTSTKKKTK